MRTAEGITNRESHEAPDFDLTISVFRHGPKESADGPLSEQGKNEVADFFSNAYKNVALDDSAERKVVASLKNRTHQTAGKYQEALKKDHGIEPLAVEVEEAVNEDDIMDFINSLTAEEKKNWFKYWYNQEKHPGVGPTPQELVKKFSSWLIDQIKNQKTNGGKAETDVFSHGPLMAAFTLRLEEELGQNIVTDLKAEERIDREKLLDIYEGTFGALKNINFHVSSTDPDAFKFTVGSKTISVPMEVLKKLGEKG